MIVPIILFTVAFIIGMFGVIDLVLAQDHPLPTERVIVEGVVKLFFALVFTVMGFYIL